MDLITLLVIMAVIIIVFKDSKCLVYFLGIVEILLHVFHYIGDHIGVNEINTFINQYIPTSILEIIGRYANGLFYDILSWLFVGSFLLLDYYLIQYFFKRKR